MAQTYLLEVIEHRPEVPTVLTTVFRKPDGFVSQAGQFLTYELDLPGTTPAQRRRSFTMASAPIENAIFLTCRYLIPRSQFKEVLGTLPAGATVKATGPFGRFVLPSPPAPFVFLAGGIGVTPFRSMVVQAVATGYAAPMRLVYSAKNAADLVFLDRFREAEEKLPDCRVFLTLSDEPPDSAWDGRRGRVDPSFIAASAEGLANPTFFICGPPSYVTAMERYLAELGVTRDRIKEEKFTGYEYSPAVQRTVLGTVSTQS